MNTIDKALLRCLCGEAWDIPSLHDEVMKSARHQTVAGIVVDNILDSGERIGRDSTLRYIAIQTLIRKNSARLNAATAALARLLDSNSLHYAIFKGQVVATRYPDPMLRQSGDVDFYVAACDFQRAAEVIEQAWGVVIGHVADDHHWSFSYRGVAFEMHYRCELFGTAAHQRFFDGLIEEDVLGGNTVFHINETPVRTFSPEVEIAYVFKHMFNHLLVEGVGLRQVMDIKMLLSRKECYDEARLRHIIRRMGYWGAFCAVRTLLSDFLRLPACKDIYTPHHRFARIMMNEILSGGNFGRSAYGKECRGWRKSVVTSWRALVHVLFYLPLAPSDISGLLPTRIRISLRKYI